MTSVLVLELKVKLLPLLGPKFPVAAVENSGKQVVSDDSSATVTVVAIPAVPEQLPVTSPVKAPINPVAVILPVDGLYVKVPSDSNPKLPPSTSPPAVNTIALSSFVDSLSVIVTVVQLPVTLPVTLPVKGPENAEDTIEVAPVITPASILIVSSNTIAEPSAGVIFTAPEVEEIERNYLAVGFGILLLLVIGIVSYVEWHQEVLHPGHHEKKSSKKKVKRKKKK